MGKKRKDEEKRNVLLDDVGAPSGTNPQKWNVLLRMNKTTECGQTDGSKFFRIVPKKVSYARKMVGLFVKKMEEKRKDEGKKKAMLKVEMASVLLLTGIFSSNFFRIVRKKVSYAPKISVLVEGKKMGKTRKDEGKKNAMLKVGIASVFILIATSSLVSAEDGLGVKLNEVEKGFTEIKAKLEVVEVFSQKWNVLSGNPPYLGAEGEIKEADDSIFEAKEWIRKIPDDLEAEGNAYECLDKANRCIISGDAKLELFIENLLVSALIKEGFMLTEPSEEYAVEVLKSARREKEGAKEIILGHTYFGPFKVGLKVEEGLLSVSEDFIRIAEGSKELRLKIVYSVLGESAAKEAKEGALGKWNHILLLFVCLSVIPVGAGIIAHEIRERKRGGQGIAGKVWDKISGFWIEMR